MTLPTIRLDALNALDQTIMQLETGWFTPHGDDVGFDLHSLPIAEFLAGMSACGAPGRFIDVGCGIGTKMLVARWLGWDVAGVERHADYAEAARRLCPDAPIEVADARDVDLRDYDVVYSYRLMYDLDAQHELNASILTRMRPGALYFCAGSDAVGERVAANVWRA